MTNRLTLWNVPVGQYPSYTMSTLCVIRIEKHRPAFVYTTNPWPTLIWTFLDNLWPEPFFYWLRPRMFYVPHILIL
jgi:hypothetical protein